MRFRVVYGRVDAAKASRCMRCAGSGETETYWQSGIVTTCPVCLGSGERQDGYTYEADDPTVEVGSVVLVPGTWLHPTPQEATVIALGSDYAGQITQVLKVVPA